MSMRKVADLAATVGEYTNKDGEKKKRYVRVGVVLEDEQGRRSHKIDAVPVSPEWSGWFSEFPVDNSNRPPQQRSKNADEFFNKGKQQEQPATQQDDDDVPF
jgi:single-stranded DNA-binding protein